jgi:hypothetical protein
LFYINKGNDRRSISASSDEGDDRERGGPKPESSGEGDERD